LDIAELLLENEVDVNPLLHEFPHNEPPLHRAVEEGYSDIARHLIDTGANFHRKSVLGDTALASGLSCLR
jgi:ankyrin repeat protein